MEVSTLTSYIFSFFMQTLYVYLGMKLMRVTEITKEEVQIAEARRLMKESVRLSRENIGNGFDLIFIARSTINGKKCGEVRRSIESGLRRLGVMKSRKI